jgi:acyl-CoA thioester hydrolase
MLPNFHHSTPIQIRFCDTDLLGHVNNANYLTYMELARLSYINAVLSEAVDWSADGVILAKAIIDFKLPVMLNDKLTVHVRVARLGNKSLDMEYLFVRKKNEADEVVASGTTVLVAFNYITNKTIELLPAWRKRIDEFEKEK